MNESIEEFLSKLRKGVSVTIDRWPGNDGEDVRPDTAMASHLMAKAAVIIEDFDKIISQVESENERYSKALEKIASYTQSTDLLWWQKEARQAISG